MDGYIGKSTAREIVYAWRHNKDVRFLEERDQNDWEIKALADAAEAECPVWNWRTEQESGE